MSRVKSPRKKLRFTRLLHLSTGHSKNLKNIGKFLFRAPTRSRESIPDLSKHLAGCLTQDSGLRTFTPTSVVGAGLPLRTAETCWLSTTRLWQPGIWPIEIATLDILTLCFPGRSGTRGPEYIEGSIVRGRLQVVHCNSR